MSVNRTRRRQLHVWLTEREYAQLKLQADDRGVTITGLVREFAELAGANAVQRSSRAAIRNVAPRPSLHSRSNGG
jgi:hypothetical protein